MKIENECRVDFQYRVSPCSPVIIKTICSNVVSTDIVNHMVKVEKYVDKEFTNTFEILTYSVEIINISKLFVTNVFFIDKIPTGTRFIENSVTIDNVTKRCLNPESGFYVGNIKVGCKRRITFKVVVLPQCFITNIKNYSKVQYDYVFNIEKRPKRICINSNAVDSQNRNEVFKQIVVNNSLKTPKEVDDLVRTKVKVSIQKIKTIHSPVENLYSRQSAKLCTLVIIGNIEYKVLYKSIKKNKSKKIIEDDLICDIFGFSCFMIVPVGINYLDKNKIKIKIESLSSHIVNKNTVFVNTNLLLYY